MEERILDTLRRVLGLDDIDNTCSQETCEKWDSMAQLNIILELEEEFDIQIEPEEIGRMRSFYEILIVLKSKIA